jgi:prolyl 4-hydroxylase
LLKEVELGGEKSFIAAWYLPDLKVCDELIDYFKRSPKKQLGQIGHDREVDKEIKDSLDVIVEPEELGHPAMRKYVINLMEVAKAYTDKYEAARWVNAWGIAENVNLQYYEPGAGYKQWHTERIGKMLPAANRHLVFMTYLNDVVDEGGTEFLYQGIRTQPRKGLTLIWPADWTHLHRGIVSPTEEKYIVTGWFDFM